MKNYWVKYHKTDVGLVKSAQPVHIKLKSGVRLPFQRQYPLKQHASNGIKPTIEGFESWGIDKNQKPLQYTYFSNQKAKF